MTLRKNEHVTDRVQRLMNEARVHGLEAVAIYLGIDEAAEMSLWMDKLVGAKVPFVNVEYLGLPVRMHETIDGIALAYRDADRIHPGPVMIAGEYPLPF